MDLTTHEVHTHSPLRCTKACLNDIYVTRKDYSITWLIRRSSPWLRCEVAKYSYAFLKSHDNNSMVLMVEGLCVLESIVFICFLSYVL